MRHKIPLYKQILIKFFVLLVSLSVAIQVYARNDKALVPDVISQEKNFAANIKKIPRAVYNFPIVPRIKVNFSYLDLADYDHDGIPDKYDLCPSTKGVYSRRGCPVYDMRKTVTYAKPKIGISQTDYMTAVNAFSSLEFDDKQQLIPPATPYLDNFVAFLKRRKDCTIVLSSHVDETKSGRRNKLISEQRMESVIGYMAKKGINNARMRGRALGDDMPVVDLPPTRFEVEIDFNK